MANFFKNPRLPFLLSDPVFGCLILVFLLPVALFFKTNVDRSSEKVDTYVVTLSSFLAFFPRVLGFL